MAHMHLCVIFISGIFLCGPTRGDPSLQISEDDLRMEIGGKWELNIHIWSETETECVNISVTYNGDIVATDKQIIPVEHSISNYTVTVLARYAGHAVVNFSLVDAVGDRYCVVSSVI